MRSKFVFLAAFALICCSTSTFGEAAFDLAGPKLEVSVTRAGKPLPISQVPALEPGDRIWIHPAFPESQSVRYLLVVAFLRGATNPPPEDWFIKVETWTKPVRQEGTVVTVPAQAQQALIFFAPQTGGDFSTLRSAVQGKPGAFVRAAQDLNLASLDRMRLDRYLSAIRETSAKDPKALHETTLLLARSLNLKLDSQCFDKPTEQQGPCLTQNTDQMVLDDGHGQSMLATLSTGPAVDLVEAASVTKAGGGGSFSPYLGVIVDLAHVMESLHTAQYQYIPALAIPKDEQLQLRLNNPPSFHKPMSVLVVALPPVEQATPPVLRPPDGRQVFCAQKPSLAFPLESAPSVFATHFGHDYSMHIQNRAGKSVDVAVKPDAALGGFVPEKPISLPGELGADVTAELRGMWGFQSFTGPSFSLRNFPAAADWKLPNDSANSLVVGREDTLHLHSDGAVCAEELSLKDKNDKPLKTTWKLAAPDDLEFKVVLTEASPGSAKLEVKQFGVKQPVIVPLETYAESSKLEQFSLHAGDNQGVLRGTRLDLVASLDIGGTHFLPASLKRVDKQDELNLTAHEAVDSALHSGQPFTAHLTLKDGRALDLDSHIEAPRPSVTLVGKKIRSSKSAVRLADPNDLPIEGNLSFVLKAQTPSSFPRAMKVEVGSVDGSFSTVLNVANGGLMLQDSQTVLAVLNPLKSFGPSAFGPIQFRPVAEDGTAGDWRPLAQLVRVPTLKEVRCPDDAEKQCTLYGDQLYLIDSLSAEKDFTQPSTVPSGFADTSIPVPRPRGTLLYLKLRDDPLAINIAVLPVLPEGD